MIRIFYKHFKNHKITPFLTGVVSSRPCFPRRDNVKRNIVVLVQ
jgi:hypothetical protein